MPAAELAAEESGANEPMLNDQKKMVRLGGVDMLKNDDNWHWVFVFPKEALEPFKEEGEAKKAWAAIFSGAEYSGLQRECPVKPKTTRKEFQHAVFKEMVYIMDGQLCGFTLGTHMSIDGDEVFLMVSLEIPEAIQEIAEIYEYRTLIDGAAYKKANVTIPTDKKHGINKDGTREFVQVERGLSLDKSETTSFNHYPATVTYRQVQAERLSQFRNPDLIRLSKSRMRAFFSFHSLVRTGAIKQVFAVHNWDQLEALHKQGWNNPMEVIYWPSETTTDNVQRYFGPEIAFSFHWYNLFTRFMVAPAMLSFVIAILNNVGNFDTRQESMITCAFAAFICSWSSIFMAYYIQKKNLKILGWGMKNFNEVGATVRKDFSDHKRDTWPEIVRNGMHWFLCCFFIAETLGIVWWIASVTQDAKKHPEGLTWGISNDLVASNQQVLVTLNIKVVDKLWTVLSSRLTSRENWRTEADLKGAMVLKLFLVKFVVFYYPFFYTIFLKPHIEGCGEGDWIDGCLTELNDNLRFFFVFQIGTEMGMLVYQLARTYYAVQGERSEAKTKGGSQEYSYLELQAKATPYEALDQIDDFMNQVVSFGFIVMFSVTLPVMCFLSFATNFMFKKLVAYKICYAHQRPVPNGCEGIGSWEYIISTLSYIGVFVNAYIAVFVFPLTDGIDLSKNMFHVSVNSFTEKIFLFLVAEHAMLLVKLLIDAAFGDKSTAQLRIEEHNDDNVH
ncbi:unnamed protein product [Polarella glacialis]|uniref:Anoctamin transmembrane domain-containing protein n=1 Tax=Polarella glacialis TaxID=89957 RepID=A0A813IEE7_POLGL|nr:unnamed protein product [Polarella glacialis]